MKRQNVFLKIGTRKSAGETIWAHGRFFSHCEAEKVISKNDEFDLNREKGTSDRNPTQHDTSTTTDRSARAECFEVKSKA